MDQEKIDKFRKEQQEAKLRKENMDALNNVSNSVKTSSEATKQQLETVTRDIAKSSDIEEVIKQLKETQLASYLGGLNQKSSIILADSTDLGEAVSGLGSKLDKLVECIESDDMDEKLITTIQTEISNLSQALNKEADPALAEAINGLYPLLQNLKSPEIVVPAPKVTVQAPAVDLSELNKTLDNHLRPKVKELDLSQYKAQDISSDDSFQHVGFLSPKGEWYIMENDIEGGSLRYFFGSKGYASYWKKRTSLNYKLLNEAVNAVQA
jgi:uncharacterized phage infection (PIP) family protein YhgE